MKKETQLLKDLAIHVMNSGQHMFHLDNDLLDIDGIATVLIEKKKILALSFEVTALPTHASNITKCIMEFCINDYKDYKVDIYEPYAFVFDEEGTITEVLFGEEALQYFFDSKEVEHKTKEEKIDKQKEIDHLLDQINKKGLNSLSEEQKKFLNDFSKGKKND